MAWALGLWPKLLKEGVQTFFVAVRRRGGCAQIRGQRPTIYVFGGHMQGDTELIREYRLTPLLNSVDQLIRHVETLPNHPFGIQLDTGMNRLGMEPVEWHAVRELALPLNPKLIMSHLACADDPDHEMNAKQLANS